MNLKRLSSSPRAPPEPAVAENWGFDPNCCPNTRSVLVEVAKCHRYFCTPVRLTQESRLTFPFFRIKSPLSLTDFNAIGIECASLPSHRIQDYFRCKIVYRIAVTFFTAFDNLEPDTAGLLAVRIGVVPSSSVVKRLAFNGFCTVLWRALAHICAVPASSSPVDNPVVCTVPSKSSRGTRHRLVE